MTISRKKTETPEKWDLEMDGTVIGQVTFRHKTETQRVCDASVTVNGKTYSVTDQFSIKRAITALEAQISGKHTHTSPATGATNKKDKVTA